ncbi:hypothetical protein ACFL7M_16010 [Thermodesulfobacteriota bacterium]
MDQKIIICPKCRQENDLISIDCCRCGIVFSKYYGILARDETDEGKRSDLLRKKEVEEAKAEALRKQKEEEEAKAKAFRRQEEEAKAEALRKQEEEAKAETLRKQEEEEAKAEVLSNQKEEEEEKELQKRVHDIISVLKPKTKIKDLLKKYEGQTIGINYDNSSEIKGANLAKVGDDIFSILIMDDEFMKSYPLRNIMSIIERVEGVGTDNMEEKSPFSIVIQVYHPVFS